MKVGELRKQGFKAIAGDTLTNGLSNSIKLSIGGAVAVNNGHHDDLEVVDLLWRDKTSEEHGFSGASDYSIDGWRPYLGLPSSAYEPKVSIDEKPALTLAMADAGEFPSVGYKLKFTHDIDGGFSFLHSEKYGWENGDNLEVIHSTINCHGANALIVLNAEPDVLTTAVIINPQFFDTRTEKQKAVDAAFLAFNVDKPALEAIYDLWAQKIEQ